MRGARSVGAAPFLPVLRFALLLPAFGACGRHRSPADRFVERPAAAELALGGGAARPLRPSGMVPTGDSTWAAIDRGGREVWAYHLTNTGVVAARVYTMPATTSEHVLALSADRGPLTLITNRGNVMELGVRPGAAAMRAHVQALHSRFLAFIPRADGAWGILEERVLIPEADDITDSLVFSEVASNGAGTARWAIRRGRYSSPTELLADFSGATASGDSIVIGGAVPPRVWVLTADSARVAVHSYALTGGVARTLSAAERAQVATSLGFGPTSRGAEIPRALPTIVRAWPVRRGFLIQAAAGPRESALDLYCGTAWKRRLLGGPNITDIGMLTHYVVVVRGPTAARPGRLQLYARSALSTECE